MTVRAKFRLNRVERSIGGKSVFKEGSSTATYEECEMWTLVANPVYGNGDPDHENTKFWAASPGGELKLNCVNKDAVDQLELGKEFYIDITPAS